MPKRPPSTRAEKLRNLAIAQEDIRRGFIPAFKDMPPVPRNAGVLPPPADYKPPYVPPPAEEIDTPLLSAPPEKLSTLLRKSLDAADRILSIVPDEDHSDYLKLVSLQTQVLQAVLSTQARVDETRLRGAVQDRFGELMERLQKSRPPQSSPHTEDRAALPGSDRALPVPEKPASSPNGQHAPGQPPESPA